MNYKEVNKAKKVILYGGWIDHENKTNYSIWTTRKNAEGHSELFNSIIREAHLEKPTHIITKDGKFENNMSAKEYNSQGRYYHLVKG